MRVRTISIGSVTRLLVAVAITSVTVGCSGNRIEPTIYPNEHLRRVGDAQLARDVDECNSLADQYVKDSDRYTDVARAGLTGAVIGSAGGALGGVITGANVGRSVGAGAAIGAIIPLLQAILTSSSSSSPNRETFVRYCMRDRGYQVP